MSYQVSTWAIEQACETATEKAVLLIIANYAGPDGACYPGQETIARQACCSVKSVERALAAFEARGWITRKHRQRKDGSRTSDLIHFAIAPSPEPLDQPDTVSVRAQPTRHPVQSNPTPCPIQPDTVSGLTTFEPPVEPLGEPLEGASAPAKQANGSRIPDDWTPDRDAWRFAAQHLGSDAAVADELDKFRDYWRGVPGAKGRKLDWPATWRNWCRRSLESKPRKPHDRPTPDDRRETRNGIWADIAAQESGQRTRLPAPAD